VLILKGDKVASFDTLLQVLILKEFTLHQICAKCELCFLVLAVHRCPPTLIILHQYQKKGLMKKAIRKRLIVKGARFRLFRGEKEPNRLL
jgi:hypothetical protein